MLPAGGGRLIRPNVFTRIVTPNPRTATTSSTKSLNYLARPKRFELLTLCGAFLCRAQHAGTGDALQPLHLWTGRGFASIQVAPSGRGSLVYVGGPSARLPLSPLLALEASLRCVLWRGFASLGGLRIH
jgi:hypothetical protein